MSTAVPEIEGADEVVKWFGHWPSFHDAEILELHLDRACRSWIKIHAWLMTNEIDENNYYKRDKHAVVKFAFERVFKLELTGFSIQNVISELSLEKGVRGLRLCLSRCYGLSGFIEADRMSVSLEPIDEHAVNLLHSHFRKA